MVNSRKIDDLVTAAKLRALNFIHQCKEAGVDVVVTSTFRDNESQAALYAQGRTAPGQIVTHAHAGDSFHQYRVAFDVVPVVNGKPVWDGADPVWAKIGAIGESCELEWAGRWTTFREEPHFQFRGGLTLDDFKAGKSIAAELTMPRTRPNAT